MIAGYNNRVAHINLTTGDVSYDTLNEEDVRKYIGARGLGVKYVLDNGPEVEPFSPDNLMCVMTGPLTGTEVKMSGRLAVVTKSPLTGTVTDSHMGGWTAAKLKWAGFDGLLIKGKAESPVYLYVENTEVSIHDASAYWGMDTDDAIKALQNDRGADCSVMAIGPAGENLVRFGNIMNENERASGRGGTGAVAGSKNLKAIVIKGDKRDQPKPADRVAFKEADKKALASIMNPNVVTAPRKGGLSVYGTNVLMNIVNTVGALPAKNSQSTSFFNAELVSGEYVKENILVNDPTCHACPVACKKEYEVTDGKWKVKGESWEYESGWALGPNCFTGDTEAVGYMIIQCNRLGMDTIEMGNVLSMTMEATEKGLLNGNGLAWADVDRMSELIDRIAQRQDDFAWQLGEGTYRAAVAFGDPDMAMTVKGQAIPAYDPRGIKGMGIAYATSNRGACHLRAYTPAAEIVGNVLGPAEVVDRLAWEGKGKLTVIFQNVHTMTDCLDVCKFSTFAESLDNFAEQFSAFTGAPTTVADLLKAGERVWNLERYFNNLAGIGEGSDYLPKRFTTEPADGQGSEGSVVEIDLMLKEYYAERGWVNGVVPESKLRELEII
ncbi:MAG TPA: aldehyde ferredoxin oxidoreductase family protein [Anaerolineae bacterium]|nr:aldehyde ferredoxin oxidoreductase family protein [Anaerolineae bacterium]HNU03994.1 aldehyde ferredoxin oxidoreductase family protein [Anaerolineae bacterium]